LVFQRPGRANWSKIQWLIAAFVSGIGSACRNRRHFHQRSDHPVERPLRVGDAVTSGTSSGVVSHIHYPGDDHHDLGPP